MTPEQNTSGIKIVMTDMDGTLLNADKELTPLAVKAVGALHHSDIRFTVASSRPLKGMKNIIETLHITEPVAGFNGGIIANPDLTIIQALFIETALVQSILDMIREAGLDPWVFTDIDWYVPSRQGARVSREEWVVGFEATENPDMSGIEMSKVAKIVAVSENAELVNKLEKTLPEKYGEKVSSARSQAHYLDITHKDANKGKVLSTFSKRLGIPEKSFATLGDMPSDTYMFHDSGISIAMGNADDSVKAQATYTTGSNEEDGFAHGIFNYVLKTAPATL